MIKKFLKVLILSILIIGVVQTVILVIRGLIIGGFPRISQEKVEKIFLNDFETLSIIVDYMKKSKYTEITIQSNDYIYDEGDYGTWFVHDDTEDNGKQKIKDKEIVDILDMLFKQKKYGVISKDGNTIWFQLWSNRDQGRGIAYTLDGNAPTLDYLTKFEKLKNENWYYYEEDFNEWKLRNE